MNCCHLVQVKLHTDCKTRITLKFKFSTNLTSRMHGKRKFIWQAIVSLPGSVQRIAQTLPFIYTPKPPDKNDIKLVLTEVITDARPSSLCVLLGDNISPDHSTVYCELTDSGGRVWKLLRYSDSKAGLFITRIPVDAAPGEYKLMMKSDQKGIEKPTIQAYLDSEAHTITIEAPAEELMLTAGEAPLAIEGTAAEGPSNLPGGEHAEIIEVPGGAQVMENLAKLGAQPSPDEVNADCIYMTHFFIY